ncbi:MAG: hypothetical protein IJA61_04685 [Clostridia bacterium]|nr:hypothetical protein [Clostridia bacterium]
MANKVRERRWLSPNTRAKRYAEELKNKVHMHGPKEGQPLTDKEACVRIGALQMKNDHIGIFKYKKALNEGKSKTEAKKFSRQIGGKK